MVVREGLGDVHHPRPAFPAKELVEGAFVGVLETPPSADIQYQDGVEPLVALLDVTQQGCQSRSSLKGQAALASVLVNANDVHCMVGRVRVDGACLTLQ